MTLPVVGVWSGIPLDDAHRHRHLDCVEYLRGVGGEFGSSSQATNFISAASEGDLEEVSTLFRLGNVNVNEGEYDARTALHLAAFFLRAFCFFLFCAATSHALTGASSPEVNDGCFGLHCGAMDRVVMGCFWLGAK